MLTLLIRSYGWDWGMRLSVQISLNSWEHIPSSGPILMTVGPWKPISLQTSQKRITDLDIRTYVSESLDVKLTVEFALSDKTPGHANFVLKNPNGSEKTSVNSIPTDTDNIKLSFEWKPGKVQLWYPVGYGTQPIYTIQIKLVDKVSVAFFRTLSQGAPWCWWRQEGNLLEDKSEKIGFRRARVVQNKLIDEEGLSFFFEINNIRIFCGGLSPILTFANPRVYICNIIRFKLDTRRLVFDYVCRLPLDFTCFTHLRPPEWLQRDIGHGWCFL